LIKQVEFNLSGDGMLIVAGNSQARVYDREGKKVLECVKGDPYIVDMAKTKVNIFQTCAAQKAQRFNTIKFETHKIKCQKTHKPKMLSKLKD